LYFDPIKIDVENKNRVLIIQSLGSVLAQDQCDPAGSRACDEYK